MRFSQTRVHGAYLLEVDHIGDERGYFGRFWCQKECIEMGLNSNICQSDIGVSKAAGTLRGLHYQKPPHQEVKIVRCSRGAIFDVVVDLRPWSPTFKKWDGFDLNENNARMLYVREGCAAGYITWCENTEIYYHATEFYHPEPATGIRWDDPAFGIDWPLEVNSISDNDKNWPNIEQ